MKDFLKELEDKLPELASSRDLVDLGLYNSQAALHKARKDGYSPDYIQFSPGRIRYPKNAVIEFFEKRFVKGEKREKEDED